MPKIIHYRENCIGCNTCVEHAPKQWKISSEDGKSDLIGSIKKKEVHILEISTVELENNELAAKDCPVSIIKIIKKVAPPGFSKISFIKSGNLCLNPGPLAFQAINGI